MTEKNNVVDAEFNPDKIDRDFIRQLVMSQGVREVYQDVYHVWYKDFQFTASSRQALVDLICKLYRIE